MAYVRLTLARPRPELRAEVEHHYRDLVAYVRTLPGCLLAHVLITEDSGDEVGRISIWESADAADHAANNPHSLALHAELHFDLQGVYWDRSLNTVELDSPVTAMRP